MQYPSNSIEFRLVALHYHNKMNSMLSGMNLLYNLLLSGISVHVPPDNKSNFSTFEKQVQEIRDRVIDRHSYKGLKDARRSVRYSNPIPLSKFQEAISGAQSLQDIISRISDVMKHANASPGPE